MSELKALIFDCDGVIAETERDGHRVAFNRAFKQLGIDVQWGVEEYGELVKISGGKERMKKYFCDNPGLLSTDIEFDEHIKLLHKRKTEIFMGMAANGDMPIRPGIIRLFDEAYEQGIFLAICSTSNENSVKSLIKALMGKERLERFTEIFAGDIVKRKKPYPDIYNLVKDKLNVKENECFVVEDTENGLLAAKEAGMHCIVTPSFYSTKEDFSKADIVVSNLGDPDLPKVNILWTHPNLEKTTRYITINSLRQMLN